MADIAEFDDFYVDPMELEDRCSDECSEDCEVDHRGEE